MKSRAYKFLIAAASAAAISACGGKQEEDMAALVDRCWDTALEQSMMLAENTPVPGREAAAHLRGRKTLHGRLSQLDIRFLPGTLWELYEHWPENGELRKYAEEYTGRVMPAKRPYQHPRPRIHDILQQRQCIPSHRRGKIPRRDFAASRSLATRYNGKTGVIMSWNPNDT